MQVSCTAFAVKPELVVMFHEHAASERYRMDGPYLDVASDIRLATEEEMRVRP